MEVLELVTDDYEPFRHDLAVWSEAAGHQLISTQAVAQRLTFRIQKGPQKPTKSSLAMIISSDGLEELLSPLGFALAAALEGIDVHLYIQGPAVRVLSPRYRPKLRGWARPFSRLATSGLNRAGHIPAADKLRQLHTLGAHPYLCGPSMKQFKVKPQDLIIDGLPQVEYLTFMAALNQADIHLYT